MYTVDYGANGNHFPVDGDDSKILMLGYMLTTTVTETICDITAVFDLLRDTGFPNAN